jgi:hypothetical protein
MTVTAGAGDTLADALGVVAFEASPIANLARNLSSRFDLGNIVPFSGLLDLLGLPER